MRNVKLFLIALAVSMTACADATRPSPPAEGQPVAPARSLDTEPPISQVAGAIARGLAVPDARRTILAAMRASVQVEHQLVLGEYLRSPEGAGLLAGSATALAVDEADFLARVTKLDQVAQLVISVPFRKHRLAWRGTPNIGVAGSLDVDVLDFAVHEPGGHQEAVTDLTRVESYDAFFYVRARESWGTRLDRQADTPGPVIQDPDDGEEAIVWVYEVEGKPPVAVDYGHWDSKARVAQALAEALGSLSVPGTVAARISRDPTVTHSPTVLDDFNLKVTGDAVGTSEVRITAAYSNVQGTRIRGSIRLTGVVTDEWYYSESLARADFDRPHLLPVSPKLGGTRFAVAAVETDVFFDDNLGRKVFGYASGGRSVDLTGITINLVW